MKISNENCYHVSPDLDLIQMGLGQFKLSASPEKAQGQVFGFIYRKLRQTVSKEGLKMIDGLDDVMAQAKSFNLILIDSINN